MTFNVSVYVLRLGHCALYDGPKILHRDISMNNIMFRCEKDKRVVGSS